MKAIATYEPKAIHDLDPLVEIEMDKPIAKARDLLVKIKAISINPADTKVRKSYKSENNIPRILGWDAAGIVEDIGSDVVDFKIGDEVYYAGAIDRPGSYSEYQVVDERVVSKKPSNLSFSDSVAYPLVSLTAWEALFDRLLIGSTENNDQDQSILIIGGAGGVGSIAIQLVKALTQLKVIATASRTASRDWVRSLGADDVINHHESLIEQFNRLNIKKPKYVFSTNSTDSYVDDIKEIIKPQGSLVLIDDPTHLDINPFKAKSISVHWEFMFTRTLFQTEDMKKQSIILSNMSALIEKGKIKKINNLNLTGFNVENIIKAHALIEENTAIGKITIEF